MDRLDPRKILHQSEKLLELKVTGDTWPVHIQIGLTSFCNHRCLFCYGGHSSERKLDAVMDFDVLLSALHQAKAHGLKAVTFVGNGEPLCYPRIRDLLKALQEMELEIGIFTNGALLERDLREFVAQYCTFIRFSVNGGTAEDHAKVHQVPGDFDKIVSNIRDLVALRHANEVREGRIPTIGVQMVFYEDNYRSVVSATRLWKDVGVDYFEIKPYVEAPYELYDKILAAQDEKSVLKELKTAKALEDDQFRVYAKYQMYKNTMSRPDYRTYRVCSAQALSGVIAEDGNVMLCCNLHPHVLRPFGNINEQSFEDIWSGERRKQILAGIDVKKCPVGCHLDAFNEVLWDYLHPKKENHIDFV